MAYVLISKELKMTEFWSKI